MDARPANSNDLCVVKASLTSAKCWPYFSVVSTTIRSTYALDVETVQMLDRLARQWAVSKSEALRRAIRAAAEQGMSAEREAHRFAWRQLQTGVRLTPEASQGVGTTGAGRAARLARSALVIHLDRISDSRASPGSRGGE